MVRRSNPAASPEPAVLEPPWIHSITGCFGWGGHSAVETFRYRQSSPLPVT